MDSHYFLGRSELLQWINDTLGLHLTKIEDTASGAVAVQLMDALHPGVVPIKKVDFNAKSEYDYINNYKVLQDVFSKLSISKHIEVQKLIKGKPLDNIEFMQWFKSYFDGVTGGHAINDYDGPGRRALSKSGDVKQSGGPRPSAPRPAAVSSTAAKKPIPSTMPSNSSIGMSKASNSQAPMSDLHSELQEWRAKAETYEKEKEFYYAKLRDIELLCSTPAIQSIPVIRHVEAVLYAPTIEEGEAALDVAQREYDS